MFQIVYHSFFCSWQCFNPSIYLSIYLWFASCLPFLCSIFRYSKLILSLALSWTYTLFFFQIKKNIFVLLRLFYVVNFTFIIILFSTPAKNSFKFNSFYFALSHFLSSFQMPSFFYFLLVFCFIFCWFVWGFLIFLFFFFSYVTFFSHLKAFLMH